MTASRISRAISVKAALRSGSAELRRNAEERLKERQSKDGVGARTESEAQRLVHELEVHQIELELQNAELQRAGEELEAALEKYTDLYDFAPVGYFSLDESGVILEANLTSAVLLGVERSRLIQRRLALLIAPASRDLFPDFLKKVFMEPKSQTWEALLRKEGGGTFWASFRARAALRSNGAPKWCRVAMENITERKTAETALGESEKRYRTLFELFPAAVYSCDAAGVIQAFNGRAAELWGRDPVAGDTDAQFCGSFKLFRPDGSFLPHSKCPMAEVVNGQRATVEDAEVLIERPDGSRITVVVNIRPLKNDRGEITGAVNCFYDITDRKLAEDKVRISEIRYRRLFEAAQDGVLLLDPGTCQITDANPFMTKLLGYSHDQLVGKELFEIGLLKDQAASRQMFRKLKQQHEVRYENLPLESRGGRHQEVEVVANLYEESTHAVIQCNIRDITERKQAEDMLRRNEALFAALVAQAPVGVYVVDARLRLQQVNPRAQSVFKKVHPLIGRDFSEVMHLLWPGRIAAQLVKRFRHTLKTGVSYQSPDFVEQRRDTGVTESYEWQIQRVTLPAGEQGVVCFFSNITERKQAMQVQQRLAVVSASNAKLEREILRRKAVELSLQQSQQHQGRLLLESGRMQEQLRHLSHQFLYAQEEEQKRISRELHDEIAQTLTGINVRLAALRIEAMNKSKDLPGKIASTQRMVAKSVDIVHRFARELRPTALDDLGLIPALHSFVKNFSKRTGIHIHLTIYAGIEKLDIGKRTILYRVTQEALTNVSRHAHASRVEVSIRKLRGAARLEIKDNGKSFQADRVLQAKKVNRLGLLGMRERVEMVGGRFTVESAPGKGTTICAQIPLGKVRRGGGIR